MSNRYPPEAWTRLGRYLTARRVHIDPTRYKTRQAFAAETGVNYRLLQDLETASRSTFTDETVALFETAYQLEPGAIVRFLEGAESELPSSPSPAAQPTPSIAETPPDLPPSEGEMAGVAAIEALVQTLRAELAEVRREVQDLQHKLDRESDNGPHRQRRGA